MIGFSYVALLNTVLFTKAYVTQILQKTSIMIQTDIM